MRRKIDEQLLSWKTSQNRKPLIVNGARQTGKTWSIEHFAQKNFTDLFAIDFSAQTSAARIFDGDITPKALLPQLSALNHRPIDPQNTLLFFDEIQACPRALTALKYFCEQAPQYHVVAAGSLLGVAVNREKYSYPVGKVDTLALRPLDFEEYLWALGEQDLAELIQQAYDSPAAFGLHDHAISRFSSYLLCGGMPEVTQAAVQGAALPELRRLQSTINEGYLADMTKYASAAGSSKILNVWRGVPEQLAKANHKFQYTTISSAARAHQYEASIEWLKDAGMIEFCYRVSEGHAPLEAFAERDFFKLYLLDVGLLTALYRVEPGDLEPHADKGARFRGGVTENYVIQQLLASEIVPYYWGRASQSEVEFVFRNANGDIIPIEVKSGKNVTAKSLSAYRSAYQPPFVIRCSRKNFGEEGGIRSVPLYAAHCIR